MLDAELQLANAKSQWQAQERINQGYRARGIVVPVADWERCVQLRAQYNAALWRFNRAREGAK